MSLFSSSTFSRIRKGSTFSSSLWSKGNYVTHRQNQFIKIPLSTISTDSFYLNNLSSNATLKTELNQLRDNKGSTKNIKRVGRGPGSGLGKTCGKGHKGKKARGNAIKIGFEGGQYPLYKKLRKYGFKNSKFKRVYQPVALGKIQLWIDTGRIDPTQKITMKTLIDSGCCGKLRKGQVGIKILGDGSEWWNTPVDIEVSQASSSAINAIKRTNGSIKLVYYNRLGLRALLKPEKFVDRRLPYLPPPPDKINRKLINPMEQPQQYPEVIERLNLNQKVEEISEQTA